MNGNGVITAATYTIHWQSGVVSVARWAHEGTSSSGIRMMPKALKVLFASRRWHVPVHEYFCVGGMECRENREADAHPNNTEQTNLHVHSRRWRPNR